MNVVQRKFDYLLIFVVLFAWNVSTYTYELWSHLGENWVMAITMAFGSFLAGSTSQGGGAVAFPVMTLGLDVHPQGARDFALMIQAIGMSSAALAIWIRKIKVEKYSILYSGIGSVIGIFVGLVLMQNVFGPNSTKVFFTSLWLSFGVALALINLKPDVIRYDHINVITEKTKLTLFLVGVAGGVISGLVGSGLDILVFSVLVLGFRVSEKIATPTSVVLMAGISIVGFLFRLVFPETGSPIRSEIWGFWWFSIPIVVIGAPLGAIFIARQRRINVVKLLALVISAQFIVALFVVPFDRNLTALAVCTFIVGSVAFGLMNYHATRRTHE